MYRRDRPEPQFGNTFTHVERRVNKRSNKVRLVRKPLLNCIMDNIVLPVIMIGFGAFVLFSFTYTLMNM